MMSFDGDMPFPKNSPMERFFRRYGMPEFGMPNDDGMPDHQPQPHGQFVTGQGSGFFITADGYAVTNKSRRRQGEGRRRSRPTMARLMMPR